MRTALVAVLVAGLVGCGVEPGSGSCVETGLTVEAVRVSDPVAPLALTAKLTAGGAGVSGAELVFFIAVGKHGERAVGRRVGVSTTGTSGTATFVRRDGVDGLAFADERVDGYSVEFMPVGEIAGVRHCRARADGALTVG